MNFPALLGEFAPIDAQFQLNVWNVIVLVTAVVALLAALKRKPPLDSELTKLNLAIESLTQTVDKLEIAQEGRFTPPLKRNAGLRAAPGREHGFPEYERVWVIDNEHLVKFLEMNAWRKMGRAS